MIMVLKITITESVLIFTQPARIDFHPSIRSLYRNFIISFEQAMEGSQIVNMSNNFKIKHRSSIFLLL